MSVSSKSRFADQRQRFGAQGKGFPTLSGRFARAAAPASKALPPAQTAQPPVAIPAPNPGRFGAVLRSSTGNTLLMVFAVLLITNHIGRPFEHVFVGLRIPAIICSAGILAALLGGGIPALKTKIGLALVAFLGWMVLIVPVSTWRGGSVPYVSDLWKFWAVFFVVVAWAPKTLGQLKFLAGLTAVCAVFNILIAGQFNTDGRFAMSGTFGNPDDAAILAGFAIPFWIFLSSRFRPVLGVPLGVGGVIFLLRIMVLTGTRSIMISLAVLLMVWLARTTVLYRVLSVVGVALALIGILATTPASVLQRLSTTIDAFSATREDAFDEASQSAAERHELLKDGLMTTLTHPIWGVGPGQFGQYRWSTLGSPSRPKTWFKTHNTYVEVSAENGIPGVVLYLLLIGVIFTTLRRVRRAAAGSPDPGPRLAFQFATCLESALVFFAVTAVFMTVEGHPYLFLLAGFAAATERLAQFEPARGAVAGPTLPSRSLPKMAAVFERK